MAEKLSINKVAGLGIVILSAAAGVLTTALVITSNATQGSLNRMDNGIAAIDAKVTSNTATVSELDMKISIFIAEIRAERGRPAQVANKFDVYKSGLLRLHSLNDVYGNIKPGVHSPPIAR